jgi:hypothetical protein
MSASPRSRRSDKAASSVQRIGAVRAERVASTVVRVRNREYRPRTAMHPERTRLLNSTDSPKPAPLQATSGARAYVTEALALYDQIGAMSPARWATAPFAEIEFLAGNVEQAVELATTLTPGASIAPRSGWRRTSPIWRPTSSRVIDGMMRTCTHAKHSTLRKRRNTTSTSPRRSKTSPRLLHLSSRGEGVVTSEKSEGATRLLGYVDARSEALGASRQYTEQQEYDRVISVLRDAIGPDELEYQAAEAARSLWSATVLTKRTRPTATSDHARHGGRSALGCHPLVALIS